MTSYCGTQVLLFSIVTQPDTNNTITTSLPLPLQAIVRLVDDPLSDAVLHRQLAPGTRLVLGLHPDSGAVTVRTQQEEEEAQAAAADEALLATAQLAQHPSGVDGGILVTLGGGGGAGSGYGSDGSSGGSSGSGRSLVARESVVLTATIDDN